MTRLAWSLVNATSLLLDRDEREAVRGDLTEAGENAVRALLDVLDVVIRRQAAPWTGWRPWAAAFGLALPGALLLMGLSVSISSRTVQHLIGPTLVFHVFLLLAWSWTGGVVAGSLSRSTAWASAALTIAPCIFCLAKFHMESLPGLCLFLFLPPAILGFRRGLRSERVKFTPAMVLAIATTTTAAAIWNPHGQWLATLALTWPPWYLAATANRQRTAD